MEILCFRLVKINSSVTSYATYDIIVYYVNFSTQFIASAVTHTEQSV